jgi:hypothetical protein
MLRCCILSDPLVLILIMLCCICSSLGSSSSNYMNVIPILFSLFHNNPLNILIFLVPLFLYLYQKFQIVFCIMICCVTIHTCRRWLWTISYIMSRFLKVVTDYWSSSSMASSSEACSLFFIISARCIILWCLIIPQFFIIELWWRCELLCVVIV